MINNEILARPGQSLQEHINQVFQISNDRLNLLKLNIESFLNELTRFSLGIISYTHDIGKATKYFQIWIKSEKNKSLDSKILKNHSLFSSIFTIATFYVLDSYINDDFKSKFIQSSNYSYIYNHFAYISQLIVRSHHSNLKNLCTVNVLDFNEEIILRHKKRLKNSCKEFIIKLYNEIILPNIFKNNSIIITKNFQKSYENFNQITKDIFSTVERILNDQKFRFKELYHNLYMYQGKILGISKYLSYKIFFLGKLMHSILLESDKMNSTIGIGFSISNNLTTNRFNEILKNYLIKKKYLIPNETFKDNFIDINKKRRYILNKVNNMAEKILENTSLISLLSVPTGFGKTFSGLCYASSIKSPRSNFECNNFFQINPKIIYALPFLSIIEQVELTIKQFLGIINKGYKKIESTSFLTHHHLTEPIFNLENNREYDESTAELFIKSWNSQYILSTFNQLFNALFKTDKNSAIKFSKIINFTWILDEIQSIPLKYWKILEESLLIMNNLFFVNILMMSATLPKILDINKLKNNSTPQNKKKIIEIITDEDYKRILNGINRVRLEYHGTIDFCSFLKNLTNTIQGYVKKKINLLIVLNTRRSAQYTFNYIKDYVIQQKSIENKVHIEFLAATQTPKRKSKIIEKIKNLIESNTDSVFKKKNKELIILISTQCIEAGIDIDFDIVIRDFAPLDSIIQVAGRCNRNNRDDISMGIVKIYKIKDDQNKNKRNFCQYIYDSHLLRLTEEIFQETRKKDSFPYLYEEKEIYTIVNKYYENIDNFFKDGKMEEERLKYQSYMLKFEYLNLSMDFNLISNMNPYSIFIEEDKEAIEIIKKYKSLQLSFKNSKNTQEFPIKEYNKLLWVKKAIQKYIITTYLSEDEKIKLKNIDKFGDLYILSYKDLKNFYSNEIGFYIN